MRSQLSAWIALPEMMALIRHLIAPTASPWPPHGGRRRFAIAYGHEFARILRGWLWIKLIERGCI